MPEQSPQMATVRYKIFKMPTKEKPHGEIVRMGVDQLDLSSNMKLLRSQKIVVLILVKQKSLLRLSVL